MKKTILSLALVLATGLIFAQKKTTTSAVISFDATTPIDKLPRADNKTAIASLDSKTGKLAFEVTIKNFAFSNPRIQDHFNGEGWMNSDKFPTATFKGDITNLKAINFSKDGTYPVQVLGDITIHGVTRPMESTGSVVVSGSKITATSDFKIRLEDFGVNGGAIAAGKVSKEPTIRVTAEF
ncbi:MAG: YceI family protein [Ferruginibacter sp.]|nr:YceI family protein [Chitinophagaceae bacterium]MBP6287746.1 YceI family protein [Ferruginibacter sp.]MBU9937477.1 YceI family protein [Ferruginibacter sp.]